MSSSLIKSLKFAFLQAELRSARSSSQGKEVAGPRLQAAMQQLEAVVPQYRAAATALQGQVNLLKRKLAEACRDKSQLLEEVWTTAAC